MRHLLIWEMCSQLLSSHSTLGQFVSYSAAQSDSDTSQCFKKNLFIYLFCSHICTYMYTYFSIQQLSLKLLIPLRQSATVEVSIHGGRKLLRCHQGFNKMEKMIQLWLKSSVWKTNYIWNHYVRQVFLSISFIYQVSLTWL